MKKVSVDVHERVAAFLNNRKRRDITQLEESYGVTVTITALADVSPEHHKFYCYNALGMEVKMPQREDSKSRP